MMPATTTTKGANCQALKGSGNGADSGTDRADRFIKGLKPSERKSMAFSKQAIVKFHFWAYVITHLFN